MAILQDYVLIITGASSGIGLATATAAIRDGAQVLGVDISAAPASLPQNENYVFLQADLCDGATPKRVVDACHKAFGGRIDGLLNVAGVMDLNQSVDTLSDAMWERCMAINLTAPVRLMRAVIATMREQRRGSIVNVASKAALSGAVAGTAYTASKHGLIGATKNVAWRFKGEGIRCNAVCPGGVSETGIQNSIDLRAADGQATATMKLIYQAHGTDREKGLDVKPENIAECLLYLVSPRSRGVNGAIIPIDNAWSTI
ncbi:NAD(P)-binding protein [Aspergillus aurantiobrunneus]